MRTRARTIAIVASLATLAASSTLAAERVLHTKLVVDASPEVTRRHAEEQGQGDHDQAGEAADQERDARSLEREVQHALFIEGSQDEFAFGHRILRVGGGSLDFEGRGAARRGTLAWRLPLAPGSSRT